MWCISWKKRIDFGFAGLQTFQTICWVYLESFVFKKVKIFKELNMSDIFGFSFWAIQLIRKDGNGGKFRKSHFNGKRISEMIFHESELILKTINVTWYNGFFLSFLEFEFISSNSFNFIQFIYMTYLGSAFENLTEKTYSFQKF